jgi:hypothetical protein
MPRGGSRAGAGRKVGSVERKTAIRIVAPLIQGMAAKEAVTAAAILASVDEKALWLEELADPRYRLKALIYLTDKRDGKARQALELNAEGEHPDPGQRLRELLGLADSRAAAASRPS